MTTLKEIYSSSFYNSFADVVEPIVPSFDRGKFMRLIFDKGWKNKELKQRMRHTSLALHQFLDKDFETAAIQLEKITSKLRLSKSGENTLGYIFLPDYIEIYGLEHFNASVKLMELVTQFVSCEFAVRPFIIKYKDKMMKQLVEWSKHHNHHVRRLSSEGSRPRLPWAMAIPELKQNPDLVLPLLENLKQDPSEYVRRSVANNLNDIAKDHPALVITTAKRWKGLSPETDAILKHGSRTLLKRGDPEMLKHFGYSNNRKLELSAFKVETPRVKVGSDLSFSFVVSNRSGKAQIVRLEYAIHYRMKNGQLSKKVFKISERSFDSKEAAKISRRQSFRKITTRKFYPGQHKIAVILNGHERSSRTFILE